MSASLTLEKRLPMSWVTLWEWAMTLPASTVTATSAPKPTVSAPTDRFAPTWAVSWTTWKVQTDGHSAVRMTFNGTCLTPEDFACPNNVPITEVVAILPTHLLTQLTRQTRQTHLTQLLLPQRPQRPGGQLQLLAEMLAIEERVAQGDTADG